MTEEELERYQVALRTQLAERRALWFILQEVVSLYANATDDPDSALKYLSERTILRLDRKGDDATAKGLDLPLATVRESVDRFFVELSKRLQLGDL